MPPEPGGSASVWAPPGPDRASAVAAPIASWWATLYWRIFLGTALMLPGFLVFHIFVGGMLSTYIIAWHLERSQVSVLPYVIVYGGGAAAALVPASFAIASWGLRAQPSALAAWRLLPWPSLLAWPALIVGTTLVFDAIRWGWGLP